jgi:hypothetical protein
LSFSSAGVTQLFYVQRADSTWLFVLCFSCGRSNGLRNRAPVLRIPLSVDSA